MKLNHVRSLSFAYVAALRPQQWTKNLIIFAAPLFAFRIDILSIWGSGLAFALFCCVSSSFYLLNDVLDVKADRLHPVKRYRPIASGLVPIQNAVFLAIALLLVAVIVSGWQSWGLTGAILAYALLQVAYNLKLKRVVILDVFAIAAGFILRAFAGAASTSVVLSPWFLICTGMLALFLAIEKRKAELQGSKERTRSVLKQYSRQLLTRMENLVTVTTIMTYTLWSSGQQVRGASTAWMLVTVPFVLYGVFRYQFLSEMQAETERPEEVLLRDRPLQITVLGWVMTTIVILFLKHQNWLIPVSSIG